MTPTTGDRVWQRLPQGWIEFRAFGDRTPDASPLSRTVARHLVRDLDVGCPHRDSRTDGDARRGRHRCPVRAMSCGALRSGCAGRVLLVETTISECEDVIQGLVRLAARCGHFHPMAAQRTQGGDPGQAGGGNGARPGVEIA